MEITVSGLRKCPKIWGSNRDLQLCHDMTQLYSKCWFSGFKIQVHPWYDKMLKYVYIKAEYQGHFFISLILPLFALFEHSWTLRSFWNTTYWYHSMFLDVSGMLEPVGGAYLCQILSISVISYKFIDIHRINMNKQTVMLYTVDILSVVPCPFVHVQSRQAVGRLNPWYAWSFPRKSRFNQQFPFGIGSWKGNKTMTICLFRWPSTEALDMFKGLQLGLGWRWMTTKNTTRGCEH